MRTTTWLTTLRAEEATSGVNHTELVCHPGKLTEYAQEQLDKAVLLLTRAEIEMPASWLTETDQRARWETARQAVVSQVVDALDAVGKTLVALGCTDSELQSLRNNGKETEKSRTAHNRGKNSDVTPAESPATAKK